MPADTLPEGTDHILDEDGVDAAEAGDLPEDADAVAADAESEQPEPAAPQGRASAGGATADTSGKPGETEGAAPADGLRGMLFGRFEELRGQATDRAFAFAQAGKDRATGAIDDVARMVEETADEIDAKIGTQYGDYARRAAQTIGGYADAIKAKEVDALYADARELVKSSPAAAIGAAAALGFVVARLIRAGLPDGGKSGDDTHAPKA